MATDQRTRDYVNKGISEGKSKAEAIRCLKRYWTVPASVDTVFESRPIRRE